MSGFVPPITKPKDKQALSEQVDEQIKAFLAGGGRIQELEPGETKDSAEIRKHYGMGEGCTGKAFREKQRRGNRRSAGK